MKDFKIASLVFSKFSIEKHIETVADAQNAILASIAIAVIISFLFSWFLEKCASVIVTLALISFYAGAGYLSFVSWKGMQANKNSDDKIKQSKFKLYKSLLTFLVAAMSVMACMICCFWSRLVLAVKIISAAAEFVAETKRVVLVPIFMMVLTCGYVGFWTMISCYIYSTASLSSEVKKPIDTPFVPLDVNDTIKKLMYFHGFGLFWNIALLLTISNFIVTGATCLWYHRDHENNKNLLSTTVMWMLRYHMGTLAFGSFILAVVWVLTAIVEYLEVSLSLKVREK